MGRESKQNKTKRNEKKKLKLTVVGLGGSIIRIERDSFSRAAANNELASNGHQQIKKEHKKTSERRENM